MRRSHRGITDFKIISLLAGGIGIFSVMQISISERTYEIGLRKSMGATDPEILFLAAGFAIVIGLAAGAGAAGVAADAGRRDPGGVGQRSADTAARSSRTR